jgi:3-oxoacyl-[acyl-carrier protein] reductase
VENNVFSGLSNIYAAQRTGAGQERQMNLGLKNAKVLVTGGTKGIGKAIAETFAAEGADIGICARNEKDVENTVAALKAKGALAYGRVADVSDAKALKRWVDEMAAQLGGVDVIVANVSALSVAPDDESWEREFSTDMMGTVRLVNAAMPYLEKSTSGAIVTISSVSGREIDSAGGPYGPVKAAIIHYTKGLACQLASSGIRANTVSPGTTFFEGGIWNSIKDNDPELYKAALARNPTGRMATPQEVANAVVFLASSAASFITGTNLVVDGALTRGVQF